MLNWTGLVCAGLDLTGKDIKVPMQWWGGPRWYLTSICWATTAGSSHTEKGQREAREMREEEAEMEGRRSGGGEERGGDKYRAIKRKLYFLFWPENCIMELAEIAVDIVPTMAILESSCIMQYCNSTHRVEHYTRVEMSGTAQNTDSLLSSLLSQCLPTLQMQYNRRFYKPTVCLPAMIY